MKPTRRKKRQRRPFLLSWSPSKSELQFFLTSITILLLCWLTCAYIFVIHRPATTHLHGPQLLHPDGQRGTRLGHNDTHTLVKESAASKELDPSTPSTCLSRLPTVQITADVRGNLGPPSVLVQNPPGKDWIKHRWQAAANMHGTAIPGQHWIKMDLGRPISSMTEIVLDWEAANSDDYILLASMDGPISDAAGSANTANKNQQPSGNTNVGDDPNGHVWTVFDSGSPAHRSCCLSVKELGQSPGVNSKTPLHIVHTLNLSAMADETITHKPLQHLKLHIRKAGQHGWGVSLWQFDVYGVEKGMN